MKNYVSKFLLVIGTLALNTTFTPIKADITAATYNITHGKKNNWPKRQPGVCNVIKHMGGIFMVFRKLLQKMTNLQP